MLTLTEILARLSDAADEIVISSPRVRHWETVRRFALGVGFGSLALDVAIDAPVPFLALTCLALAVLLLAPRRAVAPLASLADVTDGWDDELDVVSASPVSRDQAPLSGVRTCALEASFEEPREVDASSARR